MRARRLRLSLELDLRDNLERTVYFTGRYEPGVVRFLRQGGDEFVETVRAVRFDDWASAAGLDRLDLLKLDVEGDELRALHGMKSSLRTFRPRALVVEARADTGGGDAVVELLARVGYEPTGLTLFSGNRVFGPAAVTSTAAPAREGT